MFGTKAGQIFVLDRQTGQPLTPVEERPVPAGNIEGETYSPTQPFSVGMPAIGADDLKESDMWGATPFDQLLCRIHFKSKRYTGLFTPIRELFAGVPEARTRGYDPGRFSFNVKGGRCEACQGDGVVKVEMHFLPDMYVPCDVCHGKRYNRETLEIRYRGRNISEVLDLTVEQALEYFESVPAIARKLHTLIDVGLSLSLIHI